VIQNLSIVLAHYNFLDVDLTNDEYHFLISELLPFAEEFEFREARYLALQDELLLQQQVGIS